MSTALWHVEVISRAGDTAQLAVRVANADAGPFMTDKAFVLRMLYEPAAELNTDYQRIALGPLGSAIDDDTIDDDGWLAAHGDEFIKSIELDRVVNGDVTRETSRAKIEQGLISEGRQRGNPDWEELVLERMKQFWSEPKNLPSAIYIIRATNEKWLAHLTPGQRWSSAAYA
jgi:hypothetical protein